MIRAVIFDFGSVIYKTEWNKMNDAFSRKTGINILLSGRDDKELSDTYEESNLGKSDLKKFLFKMWSHRTRK